MSTICILSQFIFKKSSRSDADHTGGELQAQKSPRWEGWGLVSVT